MAPPWRIQLAIVVSFAAITGCGQAAGPPEAMASGLPAGTANGVRELQAGPSTSPSARRDPRAGATAGGSEHAAPGAGSEPTAGDTSAAPDGATRDGGDAPGSASANAALTPEASEPPPDDSAPSESSEAGSGREEQPVDLAFDELDAYERTVFIQLAAARDATGVSQLRVDAGLVAAARERACTMARGATPLLAEDDTENIGLVVAPEPDMAATAMHDWWMQSQETRSIRLTPGFTRYGVGACSADDRVYYSERFGS